MGRTGADSVGTGARWLTRALIDGLGALLFASPCSVCGSEDGPICDACRGEILDGAGAQCPRCAMPVEPWADLRDGCGACRGRRMGFDAAISLAPYSGPVRHLCLRMKRKEGAWLARWSADLLFEARGERMVSEGIDVVAAVPLHWWRRIRRGYNQSEALAERLAIRLGRPVVRSLLRVKHTPKLADRRRGERAALLRGAFRVAKGAPLEGKTVMVVDDILTTGATLAASARALKAAGAARVVAVTLARAEGRS